MMPKALPTVKVLPDPYEQDEPRIVDLGVPRSSRGGGTTKISMVTLLSGITLAAVLSGLILASGYAT
jgi:hypothetical protein